MKTVCGFTRRVTAAFSTVSFLTKHSSLIAVCIFLAFVILMSAFLSLSPFPYSSLSQRCGAVAFKSWEQNAIQVRMLGKNDH